MESVSLNAASVPLLDDYHHASPSTSELHVQEQNQDLQESTDDQVCIALNTETIIQENKNDLASEPIDEEDPQFNTESSPPVVSYDPLFDHLLALVFIGIFIIFLAEINQAFFGEIIDQELYYPTIYIFNDLSLLLYAFGLFIPTAILVWKAVVVSGRHDSIRNHKIGEDERKVAMKIKIAALGTVLCAIRILMILPPDDSALRCMIDIVKVPYCFAGAALISGFLARFSSHHLAPRFSKILSKAIICCGVFFSVFIINGDIIQSLFVVVAIWLFKSVVSRDVNHSSLPAKRNLKAPFKIILCLCPAALLGTSGTMFLFEVDHHCVETHAMTPEIKCSRKINHLPPFRFNHTNIDLCMLQSEHFGLLPSDPVDFDKETDLHKIGNIDLIAEIMKGRRKDFLAYFPNHTIYDLVESHCRDEEWSRMSKKEDERAAKVQRCIEEEIAMSLYQLYRPENEYSYCVAKAYAQRIALILSFFAATFYVMWRKHEKCSSCMLNMISCGVCPCPHHGKQSMSRHHEGNGRNERHRRKVSEVLLSISKEAMRSICSSFRNFAILCLVSVVWGGIILFITKVSSQSMSSLLSFRGEARRLIISHGINNHITWN